MRESMIRRFEAVRQFLRERGMAAGLVTGPISMRYLTGWSNPSKRFAGLVIPADGEPALLVPALEVEEVRSASALRLVAWQDGEDPFAALSGMLRAAGAGEGRIALEQADLPVGQLRRIAGALGLAPSVLLDAAADLSPALSAQRESKDEDEIALLQQAADMLNPALDAALAAIRPGVTEREIARVLEEAMLAAGADGVAFETHVLFGPASALPHGSTGARTLEPGHVVLMDFGAQLRGYRSDITRTVCCGAWPDELARVYDVVLAANQAAIAAVKPGVPLGDVDRAARQVIEEAGYGAYFIHRTGHGLGLEIHEEPYVVAGNEKVLRPGHVITIEPGVYLPGVGGVRIEDDVVVTEDGCRVLTSWTKERLSAG
ncbi:M24 family metallopeptidase [Symbiobacterium thermophilum]|uniref:M24 family metallopeptidase n=1 Tax=Symbiobacterium thermophilum TaxID=2734 RepID=UPI0002E6F911|nr:Xaa-Pro peptidase family protein [Symbiobacterium thermophilum]